MRAHFFDMDGTLLRGTSAPLLVAATLGKADIAYGDSMSDVPLFDAVGFRVSINGDHHLQDRCDVEIRSEDLRDAYAVARRWCDGAAA